MAQKNVVVRRPIGTTAALAAGAAAVLAGCAGPDVTQAQDVVTVFTEAVTAGDGDAACRLLLPDAAATLEQEAGKPCPQAVMDPAGPFGDLVGTDGPAQVEEAHVAGRQAQVATGDDTYFLALSGDGWVITAAACEPRPQRPYDCEVEA